VKAAILDYGAGNLHSLAKAVRAEGAEVVITTDVKEAIAQDALILPGVGAFGTASEALAPYRAEIRSAIDDGMPCLGVCLGMQLLFDSSDEGSGPGLGVVSGSVRRLKATRVPQIGWNQLEATGDQLYERSALGTAYFANSFVCQPTDKSVVTAWSTHESDRFVASVRVGTLIGVQFHPEKSSDAGRRFISAFLHEASR
jgi:imidazole glycerol-phosphate synthase subunit HisH